MFRRALAPLGLTAAQWGHCGLNTLPSTAQLEASELIQGQGRPPTRQPPKYSNAGFPAGSAYNGACGCAKRDSNILFLCFYFNDFSL